MATTAYQTMSLPEFSQTFGHYSSHSAILPDTETTLQDLASCVDLAAALRESMQPSEYGHVGYNTPSPDYLTDTFHVIGASEERYLEDSCVPVTDFSNHTKILEIVDRLELPLTSMDSMTSTDDDDDTSVVFELDDLSFLDGASGECNSDGENSYRSCDRDDTPSPRSIDSSDYNSSIPAFDTIYKKTFDLADESEEEEFEKPYCKSRRGAKNVLLWKFILQVLDARPDLAKWVNRREGTFKFVDTTVMSRMWGEKKRKRDMTFEKLSRGIRHYYKSGLMSRIEGTRLVYKFNWHQVPKPYRKN